jgi:hypothetical protein
MTMPGPSVDLGPLGGVAFYAIVGLGIVALVAGITTGGMIVFVVIGAVVVVGAYLLMRRAINRVTGGRRV